MADTIYWSEFVSTDNRIRRAPLVGGGAVNTLYGSTQGVGSARGLAINPAAGRIYWNNGDLTIRHAPLDGGGPVVTLYSGVNGVGGLAIDPAAGRIYWGSPGDRTIRRAPLDGGPDVPLYTGSGTQALYAASALAIDPAAGRIYWSDSAVALICSAPLDGSGPIVPLYDPTDGVRAPFAVAVDPTGGRIYWSNWDYMSREGMICGAPLDGSGPVNAVYDRMRGVSNPTGVAIDPDPTEPELARLEVATDTQRFSIGRWLRDLFPSPRRLPARIYWANFASYGTPNPSDHTIRRAPLDGSGPFDTAYPSAFYGTPNGAIYPGDLALLRAPVGTVAPTISWTFVLDDDKLLGDWRVGGGHSGPLNQKLTCSPGIWAPDLPSYHLYRAPQSFAYQWTRDGTDIGGATSDHYTASSRGSYTCRVTATNQAGSATQTSAPVTI